MRTVDAAVSGLVVCFALDVGVVVDRLMAGVDDAELSVDVDDSVLAERVGCVGGFRTGVVVVDFIDCRLIEPSSESSLSA